MFVLLQYAINEFLHKNHNCFYVNTSLPYFRVKLSCVCLMFAYIKKK